MVQGQQAKSDQDVAKLPCAAFLEQPVILQQSCFWARVPLAVE